jgi:hypothetical protein
MSCDVFLEVMRQVAASQGGFMLNTGILEKYESLEIVA